MKKLAVVLIMVVIAVFAVSCTGETIQQSEFDKNATLLYREAVSLGYEGTLDEFLDRVRGKDGVGISNVELNAEDHLIITLTNGKAIDAGLLPKATAKNGVDGKDGKNGTNGINGENGKDGVGIESVDITNKNEIIVKLTDGTVINAGKISVAGTDGKDGQNGENGKDGADGVGIENVEITANNEIIVTLTNGEEINAGAISVSGKDGKDGENGQDGKDGINGENGKDGVDGVGIKDVVVTADNEIIIILTNGEEINAGVVSVSGKDGQDGKDGENGQDGKDGINGENGKDGADGVGIESVVITNNELIVTLTNGNIINAGTVSVSGGNGKDGVDGQDGKDGKDGKDGENGLSAYELYCKYHPEYVGSEEQWVNMMFGRELSEYSVIVRTELYTYVFNVKEGSAVDLSKVNTEKEGYKFVGWQVDGEKFDPMSAILSDIEIDAVYEKAEFNKQYANNLYETIEVEANTELIISLPSGGSAGINSLSFSATEGQVTITVVIEDVGDEVVYTFDETDSTKELSLAGFDMCEFQIIAVFEAESGTMTVSANY